MYCKQSLNNKIDRLHERSLQIIYCDKTSDFSALSEKRWFCLYSLPNIRQLATEMFKVSKGL